MDKSYFLNFHQVCLGHSSLESLREVLDDYKDEKYLVIDWSFTNPSRGLGKISWRDADPIVLTNGFESIMSLDENTIKDMLENSNVYFSEGLSVEYEYNIDEEHNQEEVTEIIKALFGVEDNKSEDIDLTVCVSDLNAEVPEYYYTVKIQNHKTEFVDVQEVL